MNIHPKDQEARDSAKESDLGCQQLPEEAVDAGDQAQAEGGAEVDQGGVQADENGQAVDEGHLNKFCQHPNLTLT